MSKIAVFAGPKGGCGKSTGATSFAAWLATRGESVVLIDADPNKHSVLWSERRAANGGRLFPVESIMGEIRHAMRSLSDQFEWIVVDTPGLDTPEIRRALAVASVAVFPCKSSDFDRETMPLVDFMVEQIQAVRPEGFAGLVYCSESPPGVSGRKAREETAEILAGAKALKLATNYTTSRKAYLSSTRNGFAAFEQGDARAAEEFNNLAQEIYDHAS